MHPASTHSSLDCAISRTTGWAFSWTIPLSPRPCWLQRLSVRLHKVYHKVNKRLCCPVAELAIRLMSGHSNTDFFHTVQEFCGLNLSLSLVTVINLNFRPEFRPETAGSLQHHWGWTTTTRKPSVHQGHCAMYAVHCVIIHISSVQRVTLTISSTM